MIYYTLPGTPHAKQTLRRDQGDKSGFTLIEIMVVIGVIGVLATIAFVALGRTTTKAKDTKRKAEIHQMGRLLQFGCPPRLASGEAGRAPQGGVLDIDLLDYANELAAQNPQYASFLNNVPRDPRSGSNAQSGYRYIISSNGQKCAIYANFENPDEPITISNITEPTAGGGTGVLQASTTGPNGTNRYYQFSN